MRILIPLLAALITAVAPATANAQPVAGTQQFDPRAVVEAVRRQLSTRYVIPERRAALDAVLARGLASGRYGVTDSATLAELINTDLETTGRDRHLGFSFDPRQAAMIAAQRNETAPDPSAFEREVRSANHGVTQLRVLPGNIRYMAYDGFMWIGPESAAALENAMRFLAGGAAIIIDIRANGGGDAEPSDYMLSHFLPAGTALYDYHKEGAAKPKRISTRAEVPAGRLMGKPLYVLTSVEAASAAESFAGNFAGFRLGEVVGENTAGAGYAADLVPIGGQFVLSLSTGRVVLASTGRDWEAVGVAPTIPTSSAQALDTAHVHALRRLLPKAPPQERPYLEALATGVAARAEPRTPELPLTAYAGKFGERTVIAEAGKLYWRRGTNPRLLLIPLGGNRFAFESDLAEHAVFAVNGNRVASAAVIRSDGSTQSTYARTP